MISRPTRTTLYCVVFAGAVASCTQNGNRTSQASTALSSPSCLSVTPDIVFSDPLNACALTEAETNNNYGHAALQCSGKVIAEVEDVASTPLTPYVQYPQGLGTLSQSACTGTQLTVDAFGWDGSQWVFWETITVTGTYSTACTPVITREGSTSAISGYSRVRLVAGGTIGNNNAVPIRVGFVPNPGDPLTLQCLPQDSNCAAPNGSCIRVFGLDGPPPAPASIVISQIYPGGGNNSGATYNADFIELLNRGTHAVSLSGYAIQYASSNGNGDFGSVPNMITPLPIGSSISPGQYFLIKGGSGNLGGAALPAPDVIESSPVNVGGTGGKVALTNTVTPLGCNGGTHPCSPSQVAGIIDLVGYGSVTDWYEGQGPAPASTGTTYSVKRLSGGCTDTDRNNLDFDGTFSVPAPRNSTSPTNPCNIADTSP
jgi:hypothetical protein